MSNKQVMAIFIIGIALLLAVFWAGLSVAKQDTGISQTPPGAADLKPQDKQSPKQNSPGQQAPGGATRYTVRVAAFGTLEQANQLTSELRSKNYISAHTQMPNGQDTLYRVNIGPYDRREAADQVANELALEGRKGVMIIPN